MPIRIQNGAGGLISNFYKDAITGKPKTEERTEPQTVTTQSFVALKEIPYKFTRVRISDNTMVEVDNRDEITTAKNYYVDYNNYDGKIYFHPLANGLEFTFTYDSIGYIITTSTRIATQWDGTTVIETLQDMMDTMNHAILVSTTYATADDLIIDIEARTLACKNSIDTKITEANNKITDVNNVITTANTTKTNLQTVIDNGNINNYQLKTDNTLSTTSKTVVGAINENKTSIGTNATAISGHTTTIANHTQQLIDLSNASAIPDYVGSILITLPVGNGDFTQLVPHNLGYKPRRIEAYIRDDGEGYCGSFPITKVTYTGVDDIAYRSLGRVGVDETNVKIMFIRKTPYINTEESYFIDFYLYRW